MKKTAYRAVLGWLAVLALAGIGAVLIVAFLLNERYHEEQVFVFNTERLVDDLLRSRLQLMAFDGSKTEPGFPQEVESFGLYDSKGKALMVWGDVPDAIFPRSFLVKGEGRYLKDLGNGRFELRRVLDGPGALTGMGMGRGRSRGGDTQGFMIARVKIPEAGLPAQIRTTLLVLIPAVWIGLILTIGFLVARQRRFATTLAHNQELLQYAEAGRTLAHEIRNPLSAILLQTALLRRTGSTGPELDVIDQETSRINELVGKVREFFKDARGEPELVNAWQKLQELQGTFSATLTLTPPQDPGILVSFDPARLRSVLENLVRNGLESMERVVDKQGLSLELDLGLVRGKLVRIQILDRGTGISLDTAKKLFTPFYTTKVQGSGIGLAMSRRFVEAAGGTLGLENREGGGVRAIIDLPQGVAP